MVAVIPGLSVTSAAVHRHPSRLKSMDQAGVTMHALSLTQPMVYWRSRVRVKLSQAFMTPAPNCT